MPLADSVWKALRRGTAAGLLATVPMTSVIAGGHAARLLRNPPPTVITAGILDRLGARRHLDEPAFHASWIVAHFGYGALGGIIFALLRPLLPTTHAIAGLVFGGIVWSLSYLHLMPSLGLYPWPSDDRRTRIAVMIAAHAVYGITLAEMNRRLLAAGRAGRADRGAGDQRIGGRRP